MANVKTNLTSLAEQINFMEKTIELINNKTDKQELSISFEDVHLENLQNILQNLRMVQAWINMPDFHQAALQILDNAHEVNAALQKGGDGSMSIFHYLEQIEGLTHRFACTGSNSVEERELVMRIASLALIAVAKFIVPVQQKEVRNG